MVTQTMNASHSFSINVRLRLSSSSTFLFNPSILSCYPPLFFGPKRLLIVSLCSCMNLNAGMSTGFINICKQICMNALAAWACARGERHGAASTRLIKGCVCVCVRSNTVNNHFWGKWDPIKQKKLDKTTFVYHNSGSQSLVWMSGFQKRFFAQPF